ncbi:MAG: efflux RND transporter periplasmic adaptor subunit [Candidatus Brocadiaceae bacterium]|nr:efflux RND transporter periplasmic adaptor subunit [Candidatus Brocadiaceae bacterium]
MRKTLARFRWPAVVLLLALAWFALRRLQSVEVDVAVVERGPVREVVTEEARTQLRTERIVTADLPGTAHRVRLREGDPVEAGQVLTTIDGTELAILQETLRAQLAEVEARLAGVDVPLPKPSELAAAEQDALRTLHEAEALEREVEGAEADLRFATDEDRRARALFEAGSIPDREYELARRHLATMQAARDSLAARLAAARAGAEVARLRRQVLQESLADTAHLHDVYAAQIAQSRSNIALLAHELGKTDVRSPIAGVLLEKHLDSDRFVQPGTPLATVGDPTSIEIRADILSDDIRRIREGQPVRLLGRAVTDPTASGRVARVFPSGFTKISSLGVRQQRVAVLIEFDNSTLGLKPGSELDVRIVVDTCQDAVTVPADCVFSAAEGMAVFAVEAGRARLRPVALGLKGQETYQVTDGLSPGERVIRRPPTDLSAGRRVKARPD